MRLYELAARVLPTERNALIFYNVVHFHIKVRSIRRTWCLPASILLNNDEILGFEPKSHMRRNR